MLIYSSFLIFFFVFGTQNKRGGGMVELVFCSTTAHKSDKVIRERERERKKKGGKGRKCKKSIFHQIQIYKYMSIEIYKIVLHLI